MCSAFPAAPSSRSTTPSPQRPPRRDRVPVVARHEAGAAYMADGYARETGKLGVCVTTSGPGATNMLTGVACAYGSNVPLLALTGQSALPTFGKNALQDSSCTGVDIVGMFTHCTRYNSLVSHVDQVETKIVSAMLHALAQAPRPGASLDFPSTSCAAA